MLLEDATPAANVRSATSSRTTDAITGPAAAATGALLFAALAPIMGARLGPPLRAGSVFAAVAAVVLTVLALRRWRDLVRDFDASAAGIAGVAVAATLLALMTLSNMAGYIGLPVDLLSFSESPYVADIVRLRAGLPLYTPVTDNDAYPYAPGAQVLTYVIARSVGKADSIAAYRAIQFTYVLLAALVAALSCDQLARLVHGPNFRRRGLWFFAWLPLLVLVAFERRFNAYNHSLHNDGLALLVASCGLFVMVRHAVTGNRWLLVPMALIPALGFLVKQNHLMWAGVFGIYLLVARNVPWRAVWLFTAGAAAAAAAAVFVLYTLWGQPSLYWLFLALGDKEVSPWRIVLHLLQAGVYASMGLLAGWMLLLNGTSRAVAGVWVASLVLFMIEVYTSGLAYVHNHLGPGVVLATCWLFVALVWLWPERLSDARDDERDDDDIRSPAPGARWRFRAQVAAAAAILILSFCAIGHVRSPVNEIPDDFHRYVADIEREFDGHAPDKVLLDTGSWIYLKTNTPMKDRSAPVSLHNGEDDRMNREIMAETIRRIRERTYDKILARQLDTAHTWYDFQYRGTGIREAIYDNYVEVRRIPGVNEIKLWWPVHLVSEVIVLVPKPAAAAASGAPGARSAEPPVASRDKAFGPG